MNHSRDHPKKLHSRSISKNMKVGAYYGKIQQS